MQIITSKQEPAVKDSTEIDINNYVFENEKNKKYKELYNDYKKSLNIYYASVDESYSNFKQIKKNLQDYEKLKIQHDNLKQSISDIKSNSLDKGSKSLNEVMDIPVGGGTIVIELTVSSTQIPPE